MTRAEFVQWLILDSICDDFENVDQAILPQVAKVAAQCGLTIQRPEVVEGLAVLVHAGLAKAYDLSGVRSDPFEGELQGMPPLHTPEEHFRTYFFLTKHGMDLHQSDDSWWPLDENDEILPDWEPPRD
jgi:hypothetical protein